MTNKQFELAKKARVIYGWLEGKQPVLVKDDTLVIYVHSKYEAQTVIETIFKGIKFDFPDWKVSYTVYKNTQPCYPYMIVIDEKYIEEPF